jgi:hypothetical protein
VLWVDFALQSFRDVRKSASLKLQPGYNVVVCDSVVPETAIEAIIELLFPGLLSETGRGVLSFLGRDRGTYRVMRDFATGGAQLYALDPVKRQFTTVADGPADVAPAMHSHVVVESRDVMNDVFTLSADHMPVGATPPRPNNPAARERLRTLEEKIASQGRGKALESELDGMMRRKLEVDDIITAKTGNAIGLRQAEGNAAQFAHLSVLPDDFLLIYESAETKKAQKQADLTRWQHERDEQERLMRAAEHTHLLKDWRVIAGGLIGIAAIAAGLVIGGPYRYLAFLDIPAFGLATYALWQSLSHREDMQIAKKRLAASDRRREQIESRDVDLIGKAKEMADLVGFTTLAEVRQTMIARDAAKRALAEAQAVYDAAESHPELVAAREESENLGREIRQRELELSTMGLSGSDVGAMQAEAAQLRRLLGVRKPGEDDSLQRVFGLATQVFGGDATQTAITLTQRATQFIGHLSGKKLTRIEVDIDGSMAVIGPTGVVTAEQLTPAQRELVVLALRAALLTSIPAERRLPVLVGPFELAAGDKLLRGYLGVLAQAGLQVVHFVDKASRTEGVMDVRRFVVSA